jgi:hypothetical protein
VTARWLAAAVIAAALGLASAPATARLVDLRAGLRAGGLTGWGATSKTPDFFDHTRGGAVGLEVGVKLLVFDLSVNFTQVLDGNGRSGTLTEFLGGFVIDAPIGPGHTEAERNRLLLRPGINAGFGFGTPKPVSPPLDSAQISDKGLVTQLQLGLEYFLNPYIGVGAQVIGGYHYFFGGTVKVMDGTANRDYSSGTHLYALGTFTFHLGK